MVFVIGLSGRAGAGKDTIADMIQELKPGTERLAFADPIRTMVRSLGIDPIYLRHPNKEIIVPGLGVSTRHLMCTLGLEWGRNLIDSELWVKLLSMRLSRLKLVSGTLCVITDVRFKDEADFVRRRGGKIVNIIRPSLNKSYNHPSEAGIILKSGDFKLVNGGSVGDLRESVKKLLHLLQI